MNKANIYLFISRSEEITIPFPFFIIQPRMSYTYLHTTLYLAVGGHEMILN